MSPNSRYRFRPLIREGDPDALRIQSFKGIKNTDYSDNVTVRLRESDRLDLISFNLYGTSRFDWVLAAFNNMKFPITELKERDIIIAPSKETLLVTIIPELSLQLEAFL